MTVVLAWQMSMPAFAQASKENQVPKAKPVTKKVVVKPAAPIWMKASCDKLEKQLVTKYGEGQHERIQRGLKQVSEFWRADDGKAADLEEFVGTNFAGDQAALDTMFNRFERMFEQLNGHLGEVGREFRTHMDLDNGPIMPYDEMFGAFNIGAHLQDDMFKNKLAFVVLLNFPLTTLEQRLTEGQNWTRRQWAEARLAQWFSKRVPANVNQDLAKAESEAGQYISEYNIWMHHLVDDKGNRLFPPKMKLLAHWNLRDEIKADYADTENGPAKQKMIQQVMERIVTQTIPKAVINNPNVDWNPYTNDVKPAAVKDAEVPGKADVKATNTPEPDTRYAMLKKTFVASTELDPYSPKAPTLIARRFDENREIPEQRVKKMLEDVVSSPQVAQVAALIEKRLGRGLEPFDIWYNGFRPRGAYTEAQLDDIVRKKYPTPAAYRADLPNLLVNFGWPKDRAEWIASQVEVDPARGSGHAMGASMKGAHAHLRTRVPDGGMDYKGFNIAIHEMGHNVEQTISLNNVDHWLLNGVPNTAFTEALAFVFQGHDLEQLGLAKPSARDESLKVLNDFWGTYEIAGVALVDMQVWHWMYQNPNATPAQLKAATLQIAKDTWNKYYAPVFKRKDVTLLAIYSHMIDSFLYLPDYPMGHMIAFQVEEQMRKTGAIGPEFERMAKFGQLAPDLWMKNAAGTEVGPGALLAATDRALKEVESAPAD
jgi:hypothetical protein